MSELYKAAVLQAVGGPFEIWSLPAPEELPPGTFLLRVELTGICGTDAHIYRGHMPGIQYPVLLGHEIVGTIAALGEGVEHDYLGHRVEIGDRIALLPSLSCGTCYECSVARMPARCPNKRPTYGFKNPATTEPLLSGGYAEYLFVYNAGTIFFKTSISPERAVLMEPFAVGIHAIDRSHLHLGDTVVVQGTGAIGLAAIACAKNSGASKIIAIGGPPGRLELARRMGADYTIDIAEVRTPPERLAAVHELLGSTRGASIVFGCVGHPSAFLEGISYTVTGGVMVEVGHFTDTGSIAFNPYTDLLRRNITIEGVYGYGSNYIGVFCRSIEFLENGSHPFELMVSHQVGLSQVQDAIEALSGTLNLYGRDTIKVAVNPWV
jgi:L-iditol 2-dehydrogenase